MIFLANRTNLDNRTLLTRLHNRLQTQASTAESPVEEVWYHTSAGNKVGVRATINVPQFLDSEYPVDDAELHVSFAFPSNYSYDFYKIQWVEATRDLMIGWHQDETHMDLGNCHFQTDYAGETVQRDPSAFLDSHPLNVFEQRTTDLVSILDELYWDNEQPSVPNHLV